MSKFKEFSSDRVLFRFLMAEDANVIFQHLDWSVIKNLGVIPWPYTLEDAKEFISQSEQNRKNNICLDYLLTDKETKAFIGIISLFLIVDEGKFVPGKIGGWVTKSQRGNNYAIEAVREMIKLARAFRLEQVWAYVRQDNVPSINLLKSVGMRLIKEGKGVYEGTEMAEEVYEMNLIGNKEGSHDS